MKARDLAPAVVASLLLHGVAAAAVVVWDGSRPEASETAEELRLAVDVVWAAPPEAGAAGRPAAPLLAPNPAPEAALVAASADVARPVDASVPVDAAPPVGVTPPVEDLIPVLTPLERAANPARGASQDGLLPHEPAAEVAAADTTAALGPAMAGAAPLAAAAPSARATTATPADAVEAAAPARHSLPALGSRSVAVVAVAPGSSAAATAGDPGPMWVPAGRGNARPDYPPLARRRGLEGRTLLRVEVLASGASGTVAVISSSGYSVLDDAALAAVRQWSFVPASDVTPEATAFVEVPVSFRLLD